MGSQGTAGKALRVLGLVSLSGSAGCREEDAVVGRIGPAPGQGQHPGGSTVITDRVLGCPVSPLWPGIVLVHAGIEMTTEQLMSGEGCGPAVPFLFWHWDMMVWPPREVQSTDSGHGITGGHGVARGMGKPTDDSRRTRMEWSPV